MDKETVNNYVRKALADPLGIDGLLKLDDPVLEHRLKGGNAAYPDERFEEFKALLPYLEEEMSKSRKTHVASLPASDYGYILFVPSQRTEDFVYAISQYFKHIGGIPKILVPDNLKAAIVKSDRYEPSVNRILEDMANHYGCFILPTRPVHPKDKSLVEDHVKLVYQRVYAELRNMTFFSLDELNKAAAEKMKAHNQKRMLQHPYTREERFLAVDKPNLLPLPAEKHRSYYHDWCCRYGQELACISLGTPGLHERLQGGLLQSLSPL